MTEDTKKITDYNNLPSLPPKPPISYYTYSRHLQDAPYKALIGVVIDAKTPEKFQVLPRHRVRCQTGLTNRWRFPDSLYSDMLGTKQALKSLNMPFNHSLASHITETYEGPVRNTSLRRATKSSDTLRMGKTSTSRLNQKELFLNSARLSRPATCLSGRVSQDLFLYDEVQRRNFLRPGKAHKKHDVLLSALDINWELHSLHLNKSEVLSQLLFAAKENEIYQNNYKNLITLPQTDSSKVSCTSLDKPTSDFKHHLDLLDSIIDKVSSNQCVPVIEIYLDISDPLVTQKGLAVALSHFYRDVVKVEIQDVASVFAAAAILKFDQLLKSCGEIMMSSVNYKTVCQFHLVASQYNHEAVVMACESWLELNLIPKLSKHIEIAELGSELLDRILNSSRLFIVNELSVYKTLATWLFFKLNPQVQMMPSYTTVITYFNSLPKDCPFLENDDGMLYIPLFSSLRLHAIMDSNDIQDILLMNILPTRWVIDMLSQQHKSLHSGGDMIGLRAFHKAAIRQGIIVDGETKSYSEILSLYGFYFQLKVIKQDIETSGYIIYFQRIKPNDSAVSLKHHDRNTFSLRSEREVKYSITVQYIIDSVQHIHSTGIHAMRFGVIEKTCRSQSPGPSNGPKVAMDFSVTHFMARALLVNGKFLAERSAVVGHSYFQVLSVDPPSEIPLYVTFAVFLPPT